MSTTTLQAALDYALRGWPVLPIRAGQKIPATRHGLLDASADPAQLARWFRSGDLNLAIATGAPGPDVLDVDVRTDGNGLRAVRELNRQALLTGTQRLVATPSGGQHFYFTGTGQSSSTLRGQFLDYKAAGGYVLAPPSTVPAGSYTLQWERPATAPLDWQAVRALLAPARPKPASEPGQTDLGALAYTVATAPAGNRNSVLYWACCRAVQAGAHTLPDLDDLTRAGQQAGLTARETTICATSALRTLVAAP